MLWSGLVGFTSRPLGRRSGYQAEFLAQLDRLRPAFRVELLEEPAGMGLHCIFADEQPSSDLSIAQPRSDESQNLKLARRNAELAHSRLVHDEWTCGWHLNFLDDHPRLLLRQRQSKPNAQPGKQGSDQAPIYLHRMLDNQKTVLRQFEHCNQQATANAVDHDVACSAAARTRGGFPSQGHGSP